MSLNNDENALTTDLMRLDAVESFHPAIPPRIPKENWGLTLCKDVCVICNLYGDDKVTLKRIRDLFTYGADLFPIEKAYGLERGDIVKHATSRGWYRKRGKVKRDTRRDEMDMLIMSRIRKFWDYGNENTVDRLIQLKAKMDNLVDDRVQVEGDINHTLTWEQMITNKAISHVIDITDED